MTGLLIRLFIRNSDQVTAPRVRGAYGALAGAVGILCNLLLFAAKLTIGVLSGSVSITADAVNNLSDVSSSVMTLIGFHMAQKPRDAEHPFGHARMEYLTGLGVAALILILDIQLWKSSFSKILHPEPVLFSAALVVVLLLSIGVKLWLAAFNLALGKRISSAALTATAADSRNDVISTGAVLLSALISHFSGLVLDGYVGLLVALFVLCSAVDIARDTISPLLGASANPELCHMIRDTVLRYDPRVLGVHDLMVHDYGPGQTFASLHVEADHREDPMEIHDMIDSIERMFLERHGIHMTIHYDPIVTDDAAVTALRDRVGALLKEIDPRLTFHDFHMVAEPEHTNLIFDVVLPFDLQDRQAAIRTRLEDGLKKPGTRYCLVLTFDTDSFQ